MFDKLANIFKIPDLRKRILFTLSMLAVYRLGSHIPTPGINSACCNSSLIRTAARSSASWTYSAAVTCVA